MALFIQKALLWNTIGYKGPSGVKVASGYPKDHGFGHEEWNNSAKMLLHTEHGDIRVFHTHEVGNLPVDQHAGQIFVFMTASHHGQQVLVGVAGHATCLIAEKYREERLRLVERLGLESLWNDLVNAPCVRAKHPRLDTLRAVWNRDINTTPRWLCPESLFWWPDEPVRLDPYQLTGKKKLAARFRGFSNFSREQVSMVMSSVPLAQRDATWRRLVDVIGAATDESASDFLPLPERDITTRMAMAAQRIGQDQFRRDVESLWQDRCSVSGVHLRPLLRASHIVPWKDASHKERLDPHNGLLLAAHLDALFDAALISFTDEGTMLVSSKVDKRHRQELGLPRSLRRPPTEGMKRYLAKHRKRLETA